MSTHSIAKLFPFCRVKVVRGTVTKDASMAYVELEPDARFKPVCHICGGTDAVVKSWHWRELRDLNLGPAETWLRYTYRKIYCRRCEKTVVEDLGVCRPGERVTDRLAREIHELCKEATVSEIARKFSLDWKTVKAIDKRCLEEEYGSPRCDGLRLLAVDEIALKKGHQYMTVVLNYETGEVIWLGRDRKAETLKQFFAELTEEQRASIEAVAMDMWDPFIKAVRECLPRARHVFDLYHVVAAFHRVIDRVRIEECRRASEEDKEVFKGSKYLLFKNRKNIRKRNHRQQLDRLCRINRTISILLILRDKLKHLWSYVSPGWAAKTLRSWIEMARAIDYPEVRKFCKLLLRHFFGIVNHCRYAIHTSKLEGANNKIKLIKRKAYGYHDEKYFSLKVIQAFANESSH